MAEWGLFATTRFLSGTFFIWCLFPFGACHPHYSNYLLQFTRHAKKSPVSLGCLHGNKLFLYIFCDRHPKKGKIKPVIDRTFPLTQAKEAQLYFKQSGKLGKVVLLPEE